MEIIHICLKKTSAILLDFSLEECPTFCCWPQKCHCHVFDLSEKIHNLGAKLTKIGTGPSSESAPGLLK